MSVNNPGNGPVLHVDGGQELSADLVRTVAGFCDAVEAGGSESAVVCLTGAPTEKAVGAVADVTAVSKWEQAVRRFERLPVPTVAMAEGECGGAALDLLLAADMRIASPDLRLLPSVYEQATWPGTSSFRLVQQLGLAKARGAVLFGAPIPAAQALELGLVDWVSAEPEGTLQEALRLLSRFSGSELAIRRRLAFDAQCMSFEDALGQHLAACDRALRRGRAESRAAA
jgi:isomerase DpgB